MSYFVPAMVCTTCHPIQPMLLGCELAPGDPCPQWLAGFVLMKCPGTVDYRMVLATYAT